MWHWCLSPLCTATLVLGLQGAASSQASGSGPAGLALAGDKMAASPALSHGLTASQALSPQDHRAKAPPAQQHGWETTTASPGSGDTAPGDEDKAGPMVAFMEGNTRLRRKTHQSEQETVVLLDAAWSFIHLRCVPHGLDLLYHGLMLPLSTIASILVTTAAAIKLLARGVKSYRSWRESKEQSKEQRPGPACRAAASCPECAICLQRFQRGEALKALSCSHRYHRRCIDLWHCAQPRSKTCPLCLRTVTSVALVLLGSHDCEQE